MPPWSIVTVRFPTTMPVNETMPSPAAWTKEPAGTEMSMPQWPLYRPVGRNPRMTAPFAGASRPMQGAGANEAARTITTRSAITVLHRRHRWNNLPRSWAGGKPHVGDPTSAWAPMSTRTVAAQNGSGEGLLEHHGPHLGDAFHDAAASLAGCHEDRYVGRHRLGTQAFEHLPPRNIRQSKIQDDEVRRILECGLKT